NPLAVHHVLAPPGRQTGRRRLSRGSGSVKVPRTPAAGGDISPFPEGAGGSDIRLTARPDLGNANVLVTRPLTAAERLPMLDTVPSPIPTPAADAASRVRYPAMAARGRIVIA